jgi:hypothetical protein
MRINRPGSVATHYSAYVPQRVFDSCQYRDWWPAVVPLVYCPWQYRLMYSSSAGCVRRWTRVLIYNRRCTWGSFINACDWQSNSISEARTCSRVTLSPLFQSTKLSMVLLIIQDILLMSYTIIFSRIFVI